MIMGHFATALVPYARNVAVPLWLLLVLTNLPDLLWMALSLAGVEPTSPPSFLDVSITGMRVDMLYSHSLLVELGIAALVAAGIYAWRRDARASAWCALLVVAHLVCDWASGFRHELLLRGSPMMGLGLYGSAPYLALLVEAVFAAACVTWFVVERRRAGKPVAPRKQLALYATFVLGSLVFLPFGEHSMRELFGL